QTEPEPARRPAHLRVALAEAVEDLVQEVRRDAIARVADHHQRLPGVAVCAHADAAAARRELDRVVQHVGDRLAQAVAVSEHGAAVTDLAVELQRLFARLRQGLIDALLDHSGNLDHIALESQLPGHDARYVQDVVDQLRLLAHAALDRLEGALALA